MGDRNYQIKIVNVPLMNTYSFEIVSKWDDGNFGNGHWVFDTLTEAKDTIIAYMHEQHPQTVNDPVIGAGRIRNVRMSDLWDDFWNEYDLDMKRLGSFLDGISSEDFKEMDRKIAEQDRKDREEKKKQQLK